MNFVYCVFVLSLVAEFLFFGVASIVGYTFEGSESSPIYKIFMSMVGSFVIAVVWLDVLRGRIKTDSCFWGILVALPLFVTASYFLETGCYILNMDMMRKNLLYMVCFSYTACCAGIYVAYHQLKNFIKYFDIMMVILTISLTYATAASITGISNVGGASYQVMSYMAGFTFCLNMCMILWGDRYERFSLFKGERWNVIAYCMLVVQLLSCLVSGGRGGFVLLLIGGVYMLYRSRKIGRLLVLGILALVTAIVAGSFFESDLFAKLQNSTARTFNYLNAESDEVMEVSGRSGIFEHTIKVIQEDNYMGRGLFRSIQEIYPHNFFLEVTEQGGVLYLLFWIVMLVFLARKIDAMIVHEHLYILFPLAIYPAVFLMFSGTYTITPMFWFVICYVWAKRDVEEIKLSYNED